MPEPAALGVGLDVEEITALGRLGGGAVQRAARRWLTEEERAWWGRQEAPAEALVVVLCCKEAVYKASPRAGGTTAVRLELSGTVDGGRAAAAAGAGAVEVVWRRSGSRLWALALAHPPAGLAPGLGSRLDAALPG